MRAARVTYRRSVVHQRNGETTMEKKAFMELLEAAGVQVQRAVDRFMGNENLYLTFLAKLPKQLRFEEILQALDNEDEEVFYLRVHDLKGLAGNLELAPIYECAQAILVEFRTSRFHQKKKLTDLTREARRESEQIAALINGYFREEERK